MFSGALERSKHMHRKYTELTIKEMLSIVVKLARCSLRSILYAIVFILILASDLPGFYSRIHEIIASGSQTPLAIAMLLTLKENAFLAMTENITVLMVLK